MNYLAIVTKLANLSDIPYSTLTDVSTLTGELAILADWAKSACLDIQNKHDGQWKFLHTDYSRALRNSKLLDASAATDIGGGTVGIPIAAHGFSVGDIVTFSGTTNYNGTYTLITGTTSSVLHITATYTAETFAGTEKAQVRNYAFYDDDGVKSFNNKSFRYYLTSDGASKSTRLRYVEYRDFVGKYTDYTTNASPQVITITPDKNFRVYPAPDDDYTIEASAYLKPTELSVNADLPPFDSEFHDLVVYKGLIDYAGFEETGAVWTWASARFSEMYKELEWQQIDDGEFKVVVAG